MIEPKVILLVEDNPDDVELLQRALRANNLANIMIVARDGAEALEYFFGEGWENRSLPQVVLLDLNLPKIGGLEVLAALRAHVRTKLLPVVVLTTSDEQGDLIASYANGANSYVRKPVDFEEFLKAARTLGMYWLLVNQPPPIRVKDDA